MLAALQRRRGFFIEDMRRLLDAIERDGGVAIWFASTDGREYADVHFYLKDGEISEVFYTLLAGDGRTEIQRVSRDKV